MTKVSRSLLLLTALLGLLALPATASAGEAEVRQESKKYLSSGLAFGWVFLGDDAVQTVYEDKGRFVSKLHFGLIPWSKYIHVELNASFSFSQFTGSQRFVADGASSADWVMMTLFPLGLDLLVGIDLVYEQPVVPYGGIGLNWTIFREHDRTGQKWNGYRMGPSAFFGAAILLDTLESSRAAALDSKSGINDAFLTIEGRFNGAKTAFEDGAPITTGFGLQGWQLMIGLKLNI
jgi:hypothetical protein